MRDTESLRVSPDLTVREALVGALGPHSYLLPPVLRAWRQHAAKHRVLKEDIGIILQLRLAAASAPALLASAWQAWQAQRMFLQDAQLRPQHSIVATEEGSGSSGRSTKRPKSVDEEPSELTSVDLTQIAQQATCQNCGNVFLPDAAFCRKCGHKRRECKPEGALPSRAKPHDFAAHAWRLQAPALPPRAALPPDAAKPVERVERQLTPRAMGRLNGAGFQDLPRLSELEHEPRTRFVPQVPLVSQAPTSPLREAVSHKSRSCAVLQPDVQSLRCRIRVALNKACTSEELLEALLAAGSSSSSEPSEVSLLPDAQACHSPAPLEKCSLQDSETPKSANKMMEGSSLASTTDWAIASTADSTPEVSPVPASRQQMENMESLAIAAGPQVVALEDVDAETECSETSLEAPFMDLAASGAAGEKVTSSSIPSDAIPAVAMRQDGHNEADASWFLTPRSPRSEADIVEESQVVLDIDEARLPNSGDRATGVDEEPVATAPCCQKQSEGCAQQDLDGQLSCGAAFDNAKHDLAKHDLDRWVEKKHGAVVESVEQNGAVFESAKDDFGPQLLGDSPRAVSEASPGASFCQTLHCDCCGRPCLRTEELSNIPKDTQSSRELTDPVCSHPDSTPESKAKRRSGCCPCRRRRAAKKKSEASKATLPGKTEKFKWTDLSKQEVIVSGLKYDPEDVTEQPLREESDDWV